MSRKLTLDIILSEVNNKNNSNMTCLSIHEKNLNDISLLSKFPTLEIVSLFRNNISDLAAFKTLKNIKFLNLRDNKISDFSQLESLKNCKQLESLSLKDNPISKEPNYLQKIKEILPQLKKLDDIELNKIIKNDIKISMKSDNKKIDKLNMIKKKFIKNKGKNKNNQNISNGSPSRQNKIKNNNSKDINNKINSSGKKDLKEIKEKYNLNSGSNKKNNINKNNKNSDKKKNDEKNEKSKEKKETNDDDNFENININDEKKKLENEIENKEKKKAKTKTELLSYSFKKKRTKGTFIKLSKKNKGSNIEENATLDNIKIDNQLINKFHDENKNLNYNLSNSKYSRKIIGKFPGAHNLLSQSIRYDDENEEENNEMRFSQKNKLGSIKNRLFSKLTNQIYNKKINNNIIKENPNDNENEKLIIQSIKLLLKNLGEEELKQINNDINNAINK